MILKEKERTTIQDLQTQEKSCIEKYGRYAQQAKDPAADSTNPSLPENVLLSCLCFSINFLSPIYSFFVSRQQDSVSAICHTLANYCL